MLVCQSETALGMLILWMRIELFEDLTSRADFLIVGCLRERGRDEDGDAGLALAMPPVSREICDGCDGRASFPEFALI